MELTLEEMTTVTPLMKTIRGFQEALRGIDSEPSLDPATSEELYTAAYELFTRVIRETLSNKALLLWSDPDFANAHILDSDKECEEWIKEAERLFAANPIPDSDDPEMTAFERRNRFVKEITFEQLLRLSEGECFNPFSYSIYETGAEFNFEDRAAVVNARAEGKL